ncbi:uncharacterized protein CLAFUR5_01497 [Fulvia fulva]|uniref:Uncharacterized protein n=1 Tax=Passalora fulva TaxID=5499 RepID=A0A9Q8L634_PASFU|nr:uncharacterized protein CLAFUR5_01497 [Fulvia fulva]KAK4636072.1 hypothetical protein CLAFUR4_01496 [Fulvia fulva]KAK4637544.1 hypothetical protein CLAFUR0_01497 [Fulvia fulva]UJO11487.1 hypothetical protein CLAFUR5_01497 [Fulvia fulva]WPV23435.1 hypothetical protein CLAFUW7_01500 [Fulvia fulva]
MSSDLFAAFGEEPPQIARISSPDARSTSPQASATSCHTILSKESTIQNDAGLQAATTSTPDAFDDDDFGDFEDAGDVSFASTNTDATEGATHIPGNPAASYLMPDEPEVVFPPKAQKRPNSPPPEDSKVGKHPFAGHMDFLFEAGDDEYDAGQDDLANLANDPEAAMAYSKRIIAEQEARLQREQEKLNSASLRSNAATAQSKPAQVLSTQPQPSAKATRPGAAKLAMTASISPVQARPTQTPVHNKLRKKSGYAPAKDPNVLFDAEHVSDDESDNDDFGDFEDPTTPGVEVTLPSEPAPAPNSSLPQIDLLGLDEPPAQTSRVRSASIRKANSLLGQPKHHKSSSLANVASLMAEDNPWDDFETQSAAIAAPSSVQSEHAQAQEDPWDDFKTSSTASAEKPFTDLDDATTPQPIQQSFTQSQQATESTVPPTNIPPPALLLSLFASLFASANDTLFTPLSRLDSTQRSQLVSHPATHTFLRNIVQDAVVLAHIIAGRKLRWKRDQILAQSMRIGQAGMGGKSGMKLSSIGKGEAVQEEREVTDAVRLWKNNVGKIRGAITSTKTAAPAVKIPALPEVAETMPIKTLKSIEGGFAAPHACALCGLKREERAAKVDVDVDDSFGEWWVQGMDMHVNCRRWWNSNKSKLKSR